MVIRYADEVDLLERFTERSAWWSVPAHMTILLGTGQCWVGRLQLAGSSFGDFVGKVLSRISPRLVTTWAGVSCRLQRLPAGAEEVSELVVTATAGSVSASRRARRADTSLLAA